MMRRFTQFSAVLTLMLGYLASNAQQIVLTIESPESAKGNYALYRSSFGDQASREFNGELALATPALACEPITNNVTGKVAMVDRGTCEFAQKVQAGQDAGAIAVLICNNDGEIVSPGPGIINTGANITIPSFMMEKSDCAKIKLAAASQTVNLIFRFRPCEPIAPSNSIWGTKPGEGDFAGGLVGADGMAGTSDDWIIDTDAGKGWEWSPDGDVSSGAYIAAGTFMQTPTICNGAVLLNSDFLDNQGIAGNFGAGTCPSPCISSLISPNIDLSNVNIQGLTVQFSLATRQFLSTYSLLVSSDNGATWPDTFNLLSDYFTNDFVSTNDIVRIGLCDFPTDAKSVRLRFYAAANYYFFGLDDVFLINESKADPQTNLSFYALAPTYKTPARQASDIAFLADVRNNGAVASNNTVLRVDVIDNSTNTSIYNQSLSYGNLEPCQQVENVNFANLYKMPETEGTYTIRYDINSDGNSVSGNDIQSGNFVMTKNTFATHASEAEFGGNYFSAIGGGVNWGNIGNYYSAGNYFYVPKGDGWNARTVTFGVSDAAGGAPFEAIMTSSIYKVLGDADASGDISGAERLLVGKSEDPFFSVGSTTAGRRKITLNVFGVDDAGEVDLSKPVELESNSGYLVMIDVYPTVGTAVYPLLSTRSDTRNTRVRNFYYGASELAFSQLNIEKYYSMISTGGTNSDNPADRPLGGFFKNTYVEWELSDPVGTEDIKSDLGFDIHPNPASDVLFVDMQLEKTSNSVRLEVFDLAGRRISVADHSNIKNENLTVNTSSFNAGMYILKVTTDEGFNSRKFSVGK